MLLIIYICLKKYFLNVQKMAQKYKNWGLSSGFLGEGCVLEEGKDGIISLFYIPFWIFIHFPLPPLNTQAF